MFYKQAINCRHAEHTKQYKFEFGKFCSVFSNKLVHVYVIFYAPITTKYVVLTCINNTVRVLTYYAYQHFPAYIYYVTTIMCLGHLNEPVVC